MKPDFNIVKRITVLALAIMQACLCAYSENAQTTDSLDVMSRPDIERRSTKGWIDSLIKSEFHINSPSIPYPKFARFCVNVYNWGDRVFNSYDDDYVVSTGKNWKFMAYDEMWMRTYVAHFSDNSLLHITSHLYDDFGLKLCFMAVNISYTWNVNSLIGQKTDRKLFDFNFTCSKFAMGYSSRSTAGNSTIRRFGNYKYGTHLDVKFDDIKVDDTRFDIFYFFNNKHYSHAAAYCFSKYQLKSAGSWILGFSYVRENLSLDFSSLPEAMLESLPTQQHSFYFRNKDYNIIGGCAYNKVFVPKKWLLNITLLPSIGYKHSSVLKARSIRDMLSTNIEGRAALVYNTDLLFASLQGHFLGFINLGKDYTFFNNTAQMNFTVGVRF